MNNPKDDNDYQDFLNSKAIQPPQELNTRIQKMVSSDLNPSQKIAFIKLITIQSFIGFITLLFCPQFNLSLTNNYELFHYFHHTYGQNICMMLCGSIFMGTGALFASSILTRSEVRLIRSKKLFLYPVLSMLALPIFLIFGAKLYLSLTIFWLLGASLSSIILFEISFKVRKSLAI